MSRRLGAVALVALVVTSSGRTEAAGSFDPWADPPTLAPTFVGAKKAPADPKRIVSLAPSTTELLFALGQGARVAGVTRYDDYPPEVKDLPKIGGFLDPSIEAVVALSPDLVVAVPNGGNRPSIDRIAALGIPVLVVPGNSLADLAHATRGLARLFGKETVERGERMLDTIAGEIRRLRAAAPKKPARVAFVYGHEPLVLAGPGSFADTLLRALGAANSVAIDVAYPTYSMEQLLVDAPDVIIDSAASHGDAARSFWSRWTRIPAVASGRVYAIDGTALLRSGPRLVEGLRVIAALVGPRP